jgi:hypothetical protein
LCTRLATGWPEKPLPHVQMALSMHACRAEHHDKQTQHDTLRRAEH